MHIFLLNTILLHAQDNEGKNVTRPRSASTDYAFTSNKSPKRFKNPQLQQEAENYNKTIEDGECLQWVLKQKQSNTIKDKRAQFRCALRLFTHYQTGNLDAINEEILPDFKKGVYGLGADYHYNLGLYHEKKALQHLKNYGEQSPRTKVTHQVLRKAISRCEKARLAIHDAHSMNDDPIIKEKLHEINALYFRLSSMLEKTPEYRQGIEKAKLAYKKQESGKDSLKRSQAKTLQQTTYLDLLGEAKKSLFAAADNYLDSAQLILDRHTLRAAEKNLDQILDIETELYESNPNTYTTEPRIKRVQETLATLKAKLKDQEMGISSVEDSLEFPVDHEKRNS